MVLALRLDECSLKVRTGPPEDDPADLGDEPYSQVWGGVVPIRESFAPPVADEHCPPWIPVPKYVTQWSR